MKIKVLLVVLCTVLLAWLLPTFYGLFSEVHSGRYFVYYSSITNHFCSVEREADSKKMIRKDVTTNEEYNLNQFDSILPLMYYRQLLADGKMPDSIQGKKITVKDANTKSFFFRYKPTGKNSPAIGLYPLFEASSGRVDLKMPDDVFRLSSEIAFIKPETNTIDEEKTARFQKLFTEVGFSFPAKLVAGNPSPRKPYDEGYFVIDNNDRLYHLKLEKNKPYLHKIALPKECKASYFTPFEPDDRSFYGFLFDEKGHAYVLNTVNYELQELAIGRIDLDKQLLVIMGNPLYWTVRVIARDSEAVFAFDAVTKNKVAEHHFVEKKPTKEYDAYIFPFEIRMKKSLSKFIVPSVKFGKLLVLGTNLLFALIFFFGMARRKMVTRNILAAAWIFCTGIFGFLAVLLVRSK